MTARTPASRRPWRSRRVALRRPVVGLLAVRPGPLRAVQEDGDDDELEQGEGGGGLEVEELGGEQVDLGLDGGVAQAAEGQHDTERRGAEQEHHARRGHDAGGQCGQGDRAQHLERRRAECRGRLLAAAVEARPQRPDGADHDGQVEEDHGCDDGDGRAVETQRTERTRRDEQGAEGDADDDGRHHERHQHEGPEEAAAPEPQPVEHERHREPREHRADGRERRRTRP